MTQILGPEITTTSVDFALVQDIVDKVNDLIDQDAKQRGRRLGRPAERQLAMARTMDVIVREGAARARQGLDMWSEIQENAIRDAVLDSMYRLGRIQKVVDMPLVEDVYIAGTRPAHVRLSDGSIVECGVVADSNEELIEQLRIIATHGSSTERQMVSSRPIIDMRLPDGQRAAGIWDVVPEPHLTIRCHRYVDITLEKLIGMGMVSRSMANFLYAAVRGRRSILVIGVPGAGKTTLLRALAQCVDRYERFASLETEYELFLHKIFDTDHQDRASPADRGVQEVRHRPGLHAHADQLLQGDVDVPMAADREVRFRDHVPDPGGPLTVRQPHVDDRAGRHHLPLGRRPVGGDDPQLLDEFLVAVGDNPALDNRPVRQPDMSRSCPRDVDVFHQRHVHHLLDPSEAVHAVQHGISDRVLLDLGPHVQALPGPGGAFPDDDVHRPSHRQLTLGRPSQTAAPLLGVLIDQVVDLVDDVLNQREVNAGRRDLWTQNLCHRGLPQRSWTPANAGLGAAERVPVASVFSRSASSIRALADFAACAASFDPANPRRRGTPVERNSAALSSHGRVSITGTTGTSGPPTTLGGRSAAFTSASEYGRPGPITTAASRSAPMPSSVRSACNRGIASCADRTPAAVARSTNTTRSAAAQTCRGADTDQIAPQSAITSTPSRVARVRASRGQSIAAACCGSGTPNSSHRLSSRPSCRTCSRTAASIAAPRLEFMCTASRSRPPPARSWA